jgi:hypothetical protein
MAKHSVLRAVLAATSLLALTAGHANAQSFRHFMRANQATVTQQGANNGAAVVQSGQANRAGVHQYGQSNTSAITQTGNGNNACLIQAGNGLNGSVTQTGDNLNAAVIQSERGARMLPTQACSAFERRSVMGGAMRSAILIGRP